MNPEEERRIIRNFTRTRKPRLKERMVDKYYAKILVRLTPEERAIVNEKARKDGMTQIGYIRKCLGFMPYPCKECRGHDGRKKA